MKLSWGRPALERTDLAPLLDIVEEITFLSYLRRTPKNVVIFAEAKFLNGQEPEELNNLYYIELLEVVQEPNKVDGHYLLKLKLDHPVSNMNSRTGGTSTIAGSKISQNGLIYKIRGSRMKISLLHTFIKAYAKPDSIQFTPALPKTRSGKIMRRILRKIAEKDLDNLGDISTLADPSAVKSLIAGRL